MHQQLISLLDWIYKKKCYFCKSSKEAVKMCSKCYEQMEFLPVKINRVIDGKKFIAQEFIQKIFKNLSEA